MSIFRVNDRCLTRYGSQCVVIGVDVDEDGCEWVTVQRQIDSAIREWRAAEMVLWEDSIHGPPDHEKEQIEKKRAREIRRARHRQGGRKNH